MGVLGRRLGEGIKTPTMESLGKLLADLDALDGDEIEGGAKELLRGARDAASHFLVAMKEVQHLVAQDPSQLRGTADGVHEGLAGQIGKAGDDALITVSAQRLLADQLKVLKADLQGIAEATGALGKERGTETMRKAMEALQAVVGRRGEEAEGIAILLSAFQLAVAYRVGRLAEGLERTPSMRGGRRSPMSP